MSAWPFLFAAGYVLDYQFVACPARFTEPAQLTALRKMVGPLVGQPTRSPAVKFIEDSLLGRLALVYSSMPAQRHGAPAADVSNRSVCLVLGIVFDDIEASSADFISRATVLLENEKPVLLNHFENFWDRRVPMEPIKMAPIMIERVE